MAFIGINIEEVDGVGAPAIVGAATSVTAFNILTRRGVPGTPVLVTDFPGFVAQFGSYFTGGLGAYLMKGFFDNGGRMAYVSRVISTDSATGHAAALRVLTDAAPANTLEVVAGFRGRADPGTWGNDLFVSAARAVTTSAHVAETAPGSVTGTALAATVDMTGLLALTLRVDGAVVDTVVTFQVSDFPGGVAVATRTQIRDAVNRRTTDVVASLSATNQLVLTSTGNVARLSNGWTSVAVAVANPPLGFPAVVAASFGTASATTTTSTTLARFDNVKVGDAIEVTNGTVSGMAKVQTLNTTTGAITWSPATGAAVVATPRLVTVAPVEFDLTIRSGGTEDDFIVETWPNLSMESDVSNYAPSVVNDTILGSKYVMVSDEGSASTVGADIPANTATPLRLQNGVDGTTTANDFIGDQASRTGFYAFDPIDVQLVCCERTDPAIAVAALSWCAGRGDCMFVGAVPPGYVAAGQAVGYGQALQGRKVYGALYGPWVVVSDPAGTGPNPRKLLPPVGHIAGIFSRIEVNRGIWKAPAGDEANLRGVIDVEYRLTDAEHTNLVKTGSVNGVRAIPRSGVVIDASRTLSTDTRWLYVNVRLLFNYVKSSLRQGLRWVRQEPNRDFLWNTIKFNSVTPFLMGLWRQGAFGTGKPSDVFTVICDASNNPPDQVDQGNLKVEVYFYPSKPAETIMIIVGQQPSGGTATET